MIRRRNSSSEDIRAGLEAVQEELPPGPERPEVHLEDEVKISRIDVGQQRPHARSRLLDPSDQLLHFHEKILPRAWKGRARSSPRETVAELGVGIGLGAALVEHHLAAAPPRSTTTCSASPP